MIEIAGAVESEQNQIGAVDGVGDLVLDASLKIVFGVFQPGGIDEQETVVNARHYVVAGSSLFAGDDGDVFVSQTIEQAGFAGVGLADESDDGEFFHIIILP